jgi:hypothetical protein
MLNTIGLDGYVGLGDRGWSRSARSFAKLICSIGNCSSVSLWLEAACSVHVQEGSGNSEETRSARTDINIVTNCNQLLQKKIRVMIQREHMFKVICYYYLV